MAEKARYGKKTQSNKHANNRNPKNKKITIIIWLVVIAIFVAGAVFFVSQFKEDNQDKVLKTAYPKKYSEFVEKAALTYNLDSSLVYAVIRTESGFNPNAESGAGACGLMQIMPSSFDWLMNLRGESGKYTTDDLFDPEINIDYGCYLIRYNLDWFNQDEICAVAGYNAGFGKVDEWLSDKSLSSDGKKLDNPDDIPIEETREYVKKVESAKDMYTKLYK
ncbi:MAG TPA: lytic transglycosylase [Ruminococcaceae bacterium]|nr:lytic transglycosylase [Oscillospiraceae bacterium]